MPLFVLLGAILAVTGFVAGYYRARDAERAWVQVYVRNSLEEALQSRLGRDGQFVTHMELSEKLNQLERRIIRLEVINRSVGVTDR